MRRSLLQFIFLFFFLTSATAEEAWQVTSRAWDALAAEDWNTVESLANRASRTWGEQAKKTNDSLSKLPSSEEAKGFANLNELATVTFLKGEALRKKGDTDGALAAYYTLLADYTFGQCWDNNGWWWQPATAAKDQIAKLTPGAQSEIHLDTDPLDESLILNGKKGICFTLRQKGKEGSWDENIPRIKAVRPYWNYSWDIQRIEQQPADITFMPMVWGAWGVAPLQESLNNHIAPQIKSGNIRQVLGFNEPDKPEQANMPYTEALRYWPMLEALNVPLCSPACANPLSDVDDSTQGVRGTWMRDFMKVADQRGYRMDYIGVHWYGGPSPSAFKQRMIDIYKTYGERPLLITEFALADWGAKTPDKNSITQQDVLSFMKNVLPWMERQNWIAGYAWFSFEIDDPNGSPSALFDGDGNLTASGRFYQSVTNEDPDGDQSIAL
jgi:hypothetical protein